MKHEYDWSKLDAGWRFSPKAGTLRYAALEHTNERGSVRYFAIDELEACAFPSGLHTGNFIALWPEARAQLAKCRVEPKPAFYAWSKLDKEWVYYDPPWRSLYSTRWAMHFPLAEILSLTDPSSTGTPHPGYFEARAQLDKCRIAANVCDGDASEFAAQSPKYNWNKLENTGWREGNGAYITNGKFNYWYTLGPRPKLEAITDKFHGSDALQAEQSAEAAIELCRRDWLDEVKLLDDRIAQCKRLEGEIDALKAKAAEVVAELRSLARGVTSSTVGNAFYDASDIVAQKLGVQEDNGNPKT